jgi:hypothetical protein
MVGLGEVGGAIVRPARRTRQPVLAFEFAQVTTQAFGASGVDGASGEAACLTCNAAGTPFFTAVISARMEMAISAGVLLPM